MPTDKLLDVLITLLVALCGGGGVWVWLSSRRKTHAEADEIATKTAMGAMLQSLEFLKNRVGSLDNENTLLREQIETEAGQREARHQEELAETLTKMSYFQQELSKTQAAIAVMMGEFEACKRTLEQRTLELERTQARLMDYLKRFPQFDEGFSRR